MNDIQNSRNLNNDLENLSPLCCRNVFNHDCIGCWLYSFRGTDKMNIYTVRDNLKNTIAGKEKYLLSIQQERTFVGLRDGEDIALRATADFLKVNIAELKRILQDVETCCENATQDSWRLNPDRSGGQFTQEEIYDTSRSGWIEP